MVYSFEESPTTLQARSAAIGSPIDELIDEGRLELVSVEPEEWTVDEFTGRLRIAVETDGADVVMIDGLRGFIHSLRGLGGNPTDHLVKIGRYLRNTGVTGIVTNEVHSITGEFRATEREMSHLADNIVVLRHVEDNGRLRKVIGVLKMRASDYDSRIHEIEITENGVVVGDPLTGQRGILTGTPEQTTTQRGAEDE